MTAAPRLAVPAVLGCLVLAGCGSNLVNSPAPPAPDEVVDTAMAHLGAAPIDFAVTDTVGYDTSEVRGGSIGLGLSGPDDALTLKGEGVQENQHRISMSLSALDSSGKKLGQLHTVEYDGGTFISSDGGRYRQVDTTSTFFGGTGLGPGDMPDATGSGIATLGAVSALGYAPGAGGGAQRYHVELGDTFSRTFVNAYATAVAAGAAADARSHGSKVSATEISTVTEQATYFKSGTLDVDVNPSTGRVSHLVLTLAVSLSFDRLAQLVGASCACQLGLPTGTLITTETVDLVVSPATGETTVSRPSPDPNAPLPGSRGVSGFSI